MPSRKSPAKEGDAASLAPNDTGCSPTNFSALVSPPALTRANKSLPNAPESSIGYEKVKTWFPPVPACPKTEQDSRPRKKEPPLPAAQSDNREASNRVDRSHSVSRRWT